MEWQQPTDPNLTSQTQNNAATTTSSSTTTTTTGTASDGGHHDTVTTTDRHHGSETHWCHLCQTGITPMMTPHPMCPLCNSEFVEEIENGNHPEDFHVDSDTGNDTDEYEEIYNELADAARNGTAGGGADGGAGTRQGRNFAINMFGGALGGGVGGVAGTPFAGPGSGSGPDANADGPGAGGHPISLVDIIQSAFQHAATQASHQPDMANGQPPNGTASSDGQGTHTEGGPPGAGTGAGAGLAGAAGNAQPNPFNIISSLLEQAFRTGATNGPGGRGTPAGVGATQFAFTPYMMNVFNMVGNPGDYVVGQSGLDNIITMFMEQQQNRDAPPPAPEAVIDSLPKTRIHNDDVEGGAECSVCQEKYTVDEECLKLPCAHTFHDDCIRPWLKMNGTCPTCRFSLTGTPPNSAVPPDDGNNTATAFASTSSTQPPAPSASALPSDQELPPQDPVD